MEVSELFMKRCVELAELGLGNTAPNPVVGSVIVHEGKIVGEGYHQAFGGPHAEVNAINQVKNKDILKSSVLYVSLEPCSHYGKTPPCTELIIKSGIPGVVIGCRDPFAEVNGRGIEKLRTAGIGVVEDVMKGECEEVNKRFLTYHRRKRPYIILKWARTGNGLIYSSSEEDERQISNYFSKVLVHKWRSEEQAIMVGYRTALNDDPELTVRHWKGKNPIRCVVDRENDLPEKLALFNKESDTIIFNSKETREKENLKYVSVDFALSPLPGMLEYLYSAGVQSLIAEGGTSLLNMFIGSGLWDEARVFTSGTVRYASGIAAPSLNAILVSSENIENDNLSVYKNPGLLL